MVHLAPFIQAIPVLSQLPNSDPKSVHALAVRQGTNAGNLPAGCQSSCQVVDTLVNCGRNLSCICVDTLGSQLEQCIICLVGADSSTGSEASQNISGWNDACNGTLSLGASSTVDSNGGTNGSASSVTNSGATGTSSSSSSRTTSTVSPTTSASATANSSPFGSKIGSAVSIKIGGMTVCIAAAFAGAFMFL